jgi:hypothetical protein
MQFVAITSSFAFLFSAATASNSSADLPFLFGATPYVELDLQRSNHSDEQYCVTINNREFCTAIEYCPLEAYQCENGFDPNNASQVAEGSYSCGFTIPLCNCSASWGGDSCNCYVSPSYPYIVGTTVECLARDQTTTVLLVGDAIYSPNDGKGATSGTLTYDIGFVDGLGFFDLQWQCPDGAEFATQRAECTCQARYRYRECSACEICGIGDVNKWRWTCPGYSADCDDNYTVWNVPQSKSTYTAGTGRFHFTVSILWTVALLLLSLPR